MCIRSEITFYIVIKLTNLGPREYNSVDRDNVLLYVGAEVRTSDTLFIYFKK